MSNVSPVPWWTNWNLNFFPDAYGNLYGGQSVEEAIYRTIQTWLPAYVREVNRQLGGVILQDILEYRYRPNDRTLSAKTQAAILVSVDGTNGKPMRTNSGYRSLWNASVQVFVFGPKDWKVTQALTYAYGAAVRAAIVQHPSLGDFAESTVWAGENYTRDKNVTSTRTSGTADIKLLVSVAETMTTWSNVPTPSLDAPGPVPTVESYGIVIDKEPIGTDLSE